MQLFHDSPGFNSFLYFILYELMTAYVKFTLQLFLDDLWSAQVILSSENRAAAFALGVGYICILSIFISTRSFPVWQFVCYPSCKKVLFTEEVLQ